MLKYFVATSRFRRQQINRGMKILHCNTNTRLSVSILERVCLHQNTAATLYTVPHGSGNRP